MGRYKATCTDQGEIDLSIFKAQGAWPQTRLDNSALYADTKADAMEKPVSYTHLTLPTKA